MADQGNKSGEHEKKRRRFSEKPEGSDAKKLSTVSPMDLAVPTPVAPRRAALSSPSPFAKAKLVTTVGVTSPLAVMPPAPSSVATKTRTLAELNPVPLPTSAGTVAVIDPVASTPPVLAAPSPASTMELAAPSPVATDTSVLVAIEKPAAVVKAEGDGAGAIVAVAVEEEDVRLTVDLPKKWLHCAVCHEAMKPPVFKCENEHAVCRACAGGGGADKHCGPCGHAVTYTHCRYIDGLVDAIKVPCLNKKHGCERSVAYHSVADHKARCAHFPCYCLDCTPQFDGSPASLLRHLTDPDGKHSWPVERIEYESRQSFVVPSEDYRRLLVAEEGGVFLLAVGAANGPARCRPVNVMCVRGNADADARPLYTGVLWVDGPPAPPGHLRGSVQVKGDVASCAVPGDMDMEKGWLHADVYPKMLQGESGEVHLRLCITKFP